MALSLQELDQQTAELLPAREVMTNGCGRPKCAHATYNDNDGNFNGNTYQKNGLIQVSALNGNFNGNTVELGGLLW